MTLIYTQLIYVTVFHQDYQQKLYTHFFPSHACYYNTRTLTETQIYIFVTSETVIFSEFCQVVSDMKAAN